MGHGSDVGKATQIRMLDDDESSDDAKRRPRQNSIQSPHELTPGKGKLLAAYFYGRSGARDARAHAWLDQLSACYMITTTCFSRHPHTPRECTPRHLTHGSLAAYFNDMRFTRRRT